MVATLEAFRFRHVPARAIPPVSTPFWPPGALAVAGLRSTGCRWPIGEVHDEHFRFCNAPRLRGSYCEVHGRVACAGGER